MAFLKTLLDGNARELAKLRKTAERVNALEPSVAALSDDELRGKTAEFRARLEAGETLDQLMPEAFAVVRETGKRVLGMRHFDVQIMGGHALHDGNVAEMRTGEGKTLVATLPVYLNALTGKGVHVVTVNDYLAKRDAEWMGPIYEALGMTVGIIQHDLDHASRKAAYDSDITYVTNNEVGFDYLRDNMAWALDQMVQRHLYFAIVDEVDSILIDEARTPLIISGQGHDATELYGQFAKIIPRLVKDEDFTVDQKAHAAPITEKGVAKVERMLGVQNLYDQRNLELTHQLNAALKAWNLFHKDQQYIVKDGEVVIVDEFTGRLMYGRRYSDGIHQAIEAKEGLDVRSEDQTLATITFQNYFRLYDKLAGMTGTAKTEEREFREIYGLAVVVLPTNKSVRRKDNADIVYRSEEAKFNAVIDDIIAEHEKGRPVLVGTRSIEKSERLAMMLRRRGIECNVLNAKYHEQEAQIIKDAGQPAAVTIATNMAGRGVDIKLGEGVAEAGGLHIIGTERHESRRIDNQLRGRSGRQGDPGTTRFYIALEDELMRLFGQERLKRMMDFVKFTDETPIEAGILSRSIENAQSKVENHNYEIRKSVLEYDDVMNKQREIIYGERRQILEGQSLRDFFIDALRRKTSYAVDAGAPEEKHPSEWDLPSILDEIEQLFPVKEQITVEELERLDRDGMKERLFALALAAYEAKEAEVTPELMRMVETQYIMLPIIDRMWVDHLYIMDTLKSGIGLRGYGQKDPRVEYEREAYEIFEDLKNNISDEAIKAVFSVRIEAAPPDDGMGGVPAGFGPDGTPLDAAGNPLPVASNPYALDGAPQYAGNGVTANGVAPNGVPSNGAGAYPNGAGTYANGAGAPPPPAQAAPLAAPRMDVATAERLLGPAPRYEASQVHTNRDDGSPSKPKASADKVGRNELCPCGSGKKYKKCHGAAA